MEAYLKEIKELEMSAQLGRFSGNHIESLSMEFSEITSVHYSYTETIIGFEIYSVSIPSYPFSTTYSK